MYLQNQLIKFKHIATILYYMCVYDLPLFEFPYGNQLMFNFTDQISNSRYNFVIWCGDIVESFLYEAPRIKSLHRIVQVKYEKTFKTQINSFN